MKKAISMVGALVLAATLSACNGGGGAGGGGSDASSSSASSQVHEQVAIKESTDRHTWYVKDYVGMNAASVGYNAMDGTRRDAYGAGTLEIIFRTQDGSYVEYSEGDEGGQPESLQNYMVVAQDLAPNTELNYDFMLDENGEEYENLVNVQNYEEIVLYVAPVSSNEQAPDLTVVEPSPDKYTRYVKDYTGRNLATCGYLSMAGTYNDSYGQGYIRFDITTDDGSYIDVADPEALKQYVVTGQSVEPNTEITMTFMTDENGEEYDNLVDTQSIESINLTVTRISE